MSKQDHHKEQLATRALATGAVASVADVPKERTQFRALIVGNPNYFGNLKASAFAPVLSVTGNTTYEEIKCVGFHPQANRLDAVVFVKQSFGYGGDICSSGTQEYVRFYISLDNGATWIDQGYTSFTANDIPAGSTGGKRLEYAVSIPSTPPRRFCTLPNVILARAILSWQSVPPQDTPDFVPVWGNVHNTHIQVDPKWFLTWVDVFKAGDLKISPEIANAIDLQQEVTVAPKKALDVFELAALYKGQGVEPHRYALAEIKQLVKSPEATLGVAHPLYAAQDKLGFKLVDVVDKIFLPITDGSTVYEELDCVGLRSVGLSDELVGVLRIKRSSGFSGGPCTEGSREVRHLLGRLQQQWHVRDLSRHGLRAGVRPAGATRRARILRALAGGSESLPPRLHRRPASGSHPRDSLVERRGRMREFELGAQLGQPGGNADSRATGRADHRLQPVHPQHQLHVEVQHRSGHRSGGWRAAVRRLAVHHRRYPRCNVAEHAGHARVHALGHARLHRAPNRGSLLCEHRIRHRPRVVHWRLHRPEREHGRLLHLPRVRHACAGCLAARRQPWSGRSGTGTPTASQAPGRSTCRRERQARWHRFTRLASPRARAGSSSRA